MHRSLLLLFVALAVVLGGCRVRSRSRSPAWRPATAPAIGAASSSPPSGFASPSSPSSSPSSPPSSRYVAPRAKGVAALPADWPADVPLVPGSIWAPPARVVGDKRELSVNITTDDAIGDVTAYYRRALAAHAGVVESKEPRGTRFSLRRADETITVTVWSCEGSEGANVALKVERELAFGPAAPRMMAGSRKRGSS